MTFGDSTNMSKLESSVLSEQLTAVIENEEGEEVFRHKLTLGTGEDSNF